MKKLYALLIILIIAYVGINVVADNFNLTGSDSTPAANDANSGVQGNGSFPTLENFTQTKINDTAVSYEDSNYNMTINVIEIDNSKNVSDIASSLESSYTSSQTIDQNGVTTYFLYKEGSEGYSSDIYFNKNGQNYKISGSDISYEDSDYFINHCKDIIDTINPAEKSGGFSRW